ncbi:MAG: bifunctional UDP-N-acetylglucosamine diphosphorylase/glucosamine-1-phosphate N-acetyltransferase GlmU [Vicinamibacterales bacterium]
MDIHVVILAAGKGTRMKSARPKVLHRVAGRPLIERVLDRAAALRPKTVSLVVGHQAEALTTALAARQGITFVVQEPQLGTAHALMTAEAALAGQSGVLVLLSGDVPLLTTRTLQTLVDRHQSSGAAATVITALVDEPHGYGRVIREGRQIARIIEEKDATAEERTIREINSGIYAFALDGLFDAVRGIAAHNAQHEYYLPDLVAIFHQRGLGVQTITVSNPDEIRGINSRLELAAVSNILRNQKTAELMASGVTVEDPATAYVDEGVTIGADTILHPGVSLEGRTTIGAGCEIHSGARIVDSTLGNRVLILNHCVITGSTIADDASVGPFAHLRPDADIRAKAKVGNFVELKKTVLGAGSKANHLTYLGNATIGEKVNIGAGTITCNYDGAGKNQTVIEDGAFVGSDSQLVAPVTIGKGAYIGSGSTIRESVPAGALAVSAGKQRNIDGWVERKKGSGQKAKG